MGRMWIAVGLAVALVGACGDDEVHGRADSGEPIDAATYDGGPDAHMCDWTGPGNGTRYVELILTEPDTIPALVNPIIADGLDSGDMTILVSAVQTSADELRLYTGQGVPGDCGSFQFTGEFVNEIVAQLDPTGFASEPFTWSIWGLTDIPFVIVDTVISMGELDTDSGVHLVRGGTLTGVLTPDNAMAVILTPGLDLYSALVGLGVEKDVDHDGDGVNDSWKTTGRFLADPVLIDPTLPVVERWPTTVPCAGGETPSG